MKKILIFIVGIIGIFGFVSADSYYHYQIGGVWNNSFGTNMDFSFFINTPYNSMTLDELCFQGRLMTANITNGIVVVGLGDGVYYYSDGKYLLTGNSEYSTYCYTFSNPLKFSNYQKIYFGLHPTQNPSFDFAGYLEQGIVLVRVAEQTNWRPTQYMTGNYWNVGNENKYFLGCDTTSNYWHPSTAIYGFSYSEISTPKFKVNYGSTFYEYTLEDNLEIHLNSPVLKDGDNYSYDGLTGINLFYNGISQFYNKSELYLFTPSWYSSNIFNPICL